MPNVYRVVGYFENWAQYRPGEWKFTPAQINPRLVTDINYAFAFFGFLTAGVGGPRLTGDYQVQPVEWNDVSELYPAVHNLKQVNPELKTHLSLGGWSFNDPGDEAVGRFTHQLFSSMVGSAAARSEFISSAIGFARRHQFDGIDLDWEYPGDLGRGGSPTDFDNFITFLAEFRDALDRDGTGATLLLTVATPAGVPSGVPDEYQEPDRYFRWVDLWAPYTDWLNVMTYDYHGPFPGETLTGVNAPLLRDSAQSGASCVRNTIENYLRAGIPAGKLVMGVPFYGRSFSLRSAPSGNSLGLGEPFQGPGSAGPATDQAGFLAYFEIETRRPPLQEVFDLETSTPFGFDRATLDWVSYDNVRSISEKCQFIIENQLGGAMVWAIGNDDFISGFPLLGEINRVLNP